MKKIGLALGGFIGLLFVIPIVFSLMINVGFSKGFDQPAVEAKKDATSSKKESLDETVSVFRVQDESYDEVSFEDYIIGVVSGEMPASYEEEALKAQAIAARSYAIKVLEREDAMYDSVKHQVYLDESQLRERWGDQYEKYHEKVSDAVMATAGEVLTHNGNVVEPLYFAMSNGKTENAVDYWGKEIPYLKSVESEWDKTSPKYEQDVMFEASKICEIFGLSQLSEVEFELLSQTEGGNVAKVSIGDKTYTGKAVRELLGLRSTDFDFEVSDDHVTITTRGYGHEVGMSQYGANELAKQGQTYDEILNYYYKDVKINKY